eukprot:882816-Rhodomonas_salina.1
MVIMPGNGCIPNPPTRLAQCMGFPDRRGTRLFKYLLKKSRKPLKKTPPHNNTPPPTHKASRPQSSLGSAIAQVLRLLKPMALNIPSNSNATPIVPELQSDEKIVQSKAFQWKGGSKGRLAKIIKLMATIVQNNVGTTALVSTDERVFVSEATNSDLKILCCITIMKRNSGHAVQYFPPQLSSVHKSYEVSRCPVFGIQVKACTLESENSTIKIFAEGSEVAKE